MKSTIILIALFISGMAFSQNVPFEKDYFKENKENPKELIFKNRINLPYEPGTDEEEIEEVVLTVNKDEWEEALETGLVYFEEIEDYEMCAKVKKLLETIN